MTRRRVLSISAGIVLLAGCSKVKKAADKGGQTGPSTGPPKERNDSSAELQLDYTILLSDGGAAKRIDEKYHFHGGDRFRVRLRPAFDAHVYILNRGPRQDSYLFLYPSPKIAAENPLPANKLATFPSADEWFTLDENPGIENVVLIASPTPLVEFNTPERTIPRDECEDRIALVERDYRPTSSRRFEDREWTKLFAARGAKTAIVLRLPLDHR